MESTIGQLFRHTKVGGLLCVWLLCVRGYVSGCVCGRTRATSVGGSNFDFQPLKQSFCLSLCVAQRSAIKKVDIRDSGHELPFLFILFTPHLGDARWLCAAAAASHEQAALHRSSSPVLSPANQRGVSYPAKPVHQDRGCLSPIYTRNKRPTPTDRLRFPPSRLLAFAVARRK